MSTRTYYRGPDAVVTDELFVWRGRPTKGFVVHDLRDVGRGRGETPHPHRIFAVVGALVAVAVAVTTLDAPISYAVGAAALSVPLMVSAATRRLRPARWELRAIYHQHPVIIYASHDQRVFNQVSRALRRSMEDARSPSRGLAAA